MIEKRLIMKAMFVIYMLLLGVGVGGVFALGVFVAPVVFNANLYINEPTMTLLDSGMIMSEVFYRFGMFLNLIALIIIAYEGYRAYSEKISFTPILFSLISIICIGVFTLYFTPYILEAQNLGIEGVSTEEFARIHKLAELDFKILLASLIGLFGYRALKSAT
jgi:hypothetical protein